MSKYGYYAEKVVPLLVEHNLVLEEQFDEYIEYVRNSSFEEA